MWLRLWRRFESWRFALPLLFVAHFPNFLFAPHWYFYKYLSWPAVVFWMTPLALLAYSIPFSCLGAGILRRFLSARLVERLIRIAAISVVPLHAALIHFYVANPMCSRE
jgi:hypothetical protein